MESFGRVAKIGIDPEANEAYFADGYLNKRIAVVDMDTGELKRYWGAYGNEPDDDFDFGDRYTPGEEPARSFVARCTAPRSPMTASCMSATARPTVFRCSRRTGRS